MQHEEQARGFRSLGPVPELQFHWHKRSLKVVCYDGLTLRRDGQGREGGVLALCMMEGLGFMELAVGDDEG